MALLLYSEQQRCMPYERMMNTYLFRGRHSVSKSGNIRSLCLIFRQ